MTKTQLKEVLREKGYECAHLDDVVHDAASTLASNTNNGGIDSQIDFLIDTCDLSPESIINKIEGDF